MNGRGFFYPFGSEIWQNTSFCCDMFGRVSEFGILTPALNKKLEIRRTFAHNR
jgi:hypothetical protein